MAQAQMDHSIQKQLLALTRDGTISCPQALALAARLGVTPAAVGTAANKAGIKITRCQLGCFGVPKEEDHGV